MISWWWSWSWSWCAEDIATEDLAIAKSSIAISSKFFVIFFIIMLVMKILVLLSIVMAMLMMMIIILVWPWCMKMQLLCTEFGKDNSGWGHGGNDCGESSWLFTQPVTGFGSFFFIFSSLGIYFTLIFSKSTCRISQLICFQFEGRIVQETILVLYF